MSKLIQARNLTKTYTSGGTVVRAVDHVTFDVAAGEYVAIVGPSGAGKSTLLHMFGGLDTPSEGSIEFNERDVYKMRDNAISLWRNQHIGFVFQFYHLIDEFTVLENVLLPARIGKKKYAFKRAEELLEYLGIAERKNFFPIYFYRYYLILGYISEIGFP